MLYVYYASVPLHQELDSGNAASKRQRNQQAQGFMTDKAQQRNEIEDHPLIQNDDVPQINQQVRN